MLLEPTLRISVYDDNIKCFEIEMCIFKLVGYTTMHVVGPTSFPAISERERYIL